VQASLRQAVDVGAKVTVAVRPQRVAIAPSRQGGSGLAGTISDIIFLGTARKYVVRLADGTECVVLRQIGDPAFDFAAAAAVVLNWPTIHATAFPD
jgi:ABC-type Fe3+/spermidine/putrescine transport system ATPase subunit